MYREPHLQNKSDECADSGIGGKNYLIRIQAVKKQKMLGKNGVTVLQNLAKW